LTDIFWKTWSIWLEYFYTSGFSCERRWSSLQY